MSHLYSSIFCMFLMLVAFSQHGLSQKTMVYGRVIESGSSGPVSFATIHFDGTQTGTYTDDLGNYYLETEEAVQHIVVSAIGYRDTTIQIRPGLKQSIRIELSLANYVLDEVVVLAGENPAFEILRNTIRSKPRLDPQYLDSYTFRSYNKTQFDLNNFSDKIKKNFLFRPFPFIWEYQDSMQNGVRYLPFLFKENTRDHYYRKKPATYREYITGRQTAQFFRGPKIEEFIEELSFQPNVYDNFIPILNKQFPSPVNDHFERYYRYLLDDTLRVINGFNCHHIHFFPDGKNDVAFVGDMYIDQQTYAVVQMNVNFSIDANINFVRSFSVKLDYQPVQETAWFPSKVVILADFTVVENAPELTGFFGRRYSAYTHFTVNEYISDSLFSGVEEVVEQFNINSSSEPYWKEARTMELSEEEQEIFTLVDTIQDNWKFKVFKTTFTALASGFIPTGPFEIGNIMTFVSTNNVEGVRFKFGIRSPEDSPFALQPSGYLAYGIKDRRWKYLGQLNWVFQRGQYDRTLLGVQTKRDQQQLGLSEYALPLDHILTSLIQFAPLHTRTFVESTSAYIERQWFTGLATRLGIEQQIVQPFGAYSFYTINQTDLTPIPRFRLGGLSFSGRFAKDDPFVQATYNHPGKRYFMNDLPVISWNLTYSTKGFLQSDFHRTSVAIRAEHDQKMNRWGYLSYSIEFGKIWGQAPYPFLYTPTGNQTLFAERTAFNMMNFMEFAADEYFACHLEHHFDGLFFNQFAFNKWTKLREFLFAKIYWGQLSEQNNAKKWTFPESIQPLTDPYLEVGFGIENILKISRIDFSWRLNYLHHEDVYSFLPKPSFQLRF